MYIAPFGLTSIDQVALMVSPTYTESSANCVLDVWYVVSGQNVGDLLLVLIDQSDRSETVIWFNNADRGDQWRLQTIGIGRRQAPFMVIFSLTKFLLAKLLSKVPLPTFHASCPSMRRIYRVTFAWFMRWES